MRREKYGEPGDGCARSHEESGEAGDAAEDHHESQSGAVGRRLRREHTRCGWADCADGNSRCHDARERGRCYRATRRQAPRPAPRDGERFGAVHWNASWPAAVHARTASAEPGVCIATTMVAGPAATRPAAATTHPAHASIRPHPLPVTLGSTSA